MSPRAIRSLGLSHFRSHKSLRLDLDGRPVAIHGPNGAGKTNILEAISLLSPGRGFRRSAPDDMARAPERLGWKIRATLNGTREPHEIETWAEPGGSRQLRIDGKTAPQTELGRIARILWLIPAMDRLWSDGASERRRFLDRIAMSFWPEHADAAVAYEKAMRERNRLLKDGSRDGAWFEALEAQMADSGAALVANRSAAIARLSIAQDGAKTAFPRAHLALVSGDEHPAEHTSDTLRKAFAVSRARDHFAGRTLVGPHRHDLLALFAAKDMEARLCSTGEQKALLISLILANARALRSDTGSPPILLLDEVAAHLDADRRAALYDEVCALGSQAWMTGTGPELFADLGARAMHLSVSETNTGSGVEIL